MRPHRRARELGHERRLGDARDQGLEDRQRSAHDGHAGVDGRPDFGARIRGLAGAGDVAEDDFDDAGDDDAGILF